MAYGITIKRNDGNAIVSQSLPGGRCFVGVIQRSSETSGTTSTYTYSNVPDGSYLRIYAVSQGCHTWTTGTSSGQATITLTAFTKPTSASVGSTTTLLVFTTVTAESFTNNIGIALVNDSGERTVSAIYPSAEFLGKITFSGTPSASASTPGGLTRYTHTSSTNLGSGRTRLILWNLPSTGNNTWYRGTNFITNNFTGSYSIDAVIVTDTSYTLPEAFVFALDNISSSGQTYGMRVKDASGNITFDAGLDHMVIKGFETGWGFSTTEGTINSYSTSYFSGIQPVFLLPNCTTQKWIRDPSPATSGYRYLYEGCIRRTDTTIYTQRILTEANFEDAGTVFTVRTGLSSGLISVVCSGALYGAGSI